MDIDGELKAELDTEGEEGEEGRWGMRVRVVWQVDVDACWVVEDMRVNWMQAEQFGLLQP